LTTAVRSPHATLGQQLYAARHRAELSAEEAACAAEVSVDTVCAVEAEKPVQHEVTAAMQGCALHCHAAELWCTGRL
jgi:DNA-binding XRE family transcriptional regulator